MREAMRIVKQLILKGSINEREDKELFDLANDENISEELYIMEEEWQFYLVRTIHNIYIVPLQENELFNVRLREIRENTRSNARNKDAYLQCYITMVILWMFFRSKNNDPQSASSLRIRDITETLDMRFKNENEAEAMEEKQINFRAISDIWNNHVLRNDGRKESKEEMVRTACRFLEKNKLIEFRDDGDEIRPRQRLIDVMTKYYLSDSRIAEINSIFEKEDNHAGNQQDKNI